MKDIFVHFTNFGYFSNEVFESADSAIEYGKSKGFEFTVVRKNGEYTLLASWSPIGGLRKFVKEN